MIQKSKKYLKKKISYNSWCALVSVDLVCQYKFFYLSFVDGFVIFLGPDWQGMPCFLFLHFSIFVWNIINTIFCQIFLFDINLNKEFVKSGLCNIKPSLFCNAHKFFALIQLHLFMLCCHYTIGGSGDRSLLHRGMLLMSLNSFPISRDHCCCWCQSKDLS